MLSTTTTNIIYNINYLTLVITIIIAVLGWIFALLLQRSNSKQQLKIEIRYDIYNQFVKLHINTQNSLSKLGAISSPPFILMDSCMISSKYNLSSEQEDVFKGSQEWRKFFDELYKAYSNFTDNYLDILYLFENWSAVFKPLLLTKQILTNQINIFKEQIYSDLQILQMYSTKHGDDWRKWDREEINKVAENIRETTYDISCFLGDFMSLLHNEVLSKYFKQKRPIRKTLSSKYKVLTTKGIIENLDHELIAEMNKHKNQLETIVEKKLKTINNPEKKKFLELLKNSKCPDCNNEIQVTNFLETEEDFYFQFICGHKWVEKK